MFAYKIPKYKTNEQISNKRRNKNKKKLPQKLQPIEKEWKVRVK